MSLQSDKKSESTLVTDLSTADLEKSAETAEKLSGCIGEDNPTSKRILPKKISMIVSIVAILMSCYHLYAAITGLPVWTLHRPTHVMFFLIIGFLTYKGFKKDNKLTLTIDCLLAVITAAIWLYIVFNSDRISTHVYRLNPMLTLDKISIVLLIVFALEMTRRTSGLPLVIVTCFFIAHTIFAKYFPGFLNGPGTKFLTYIEQMFFSPDGFFGTPVSTSSTYVFLFIVFGAFLEGTGVGNYFISMASDATRKSRGGAAKSSIMASGLFGSISGSAVANVYATGVFTIPLMKKSGFSPTFAGAVEAVASSGGGIMPPVMGSAAFLMADFVGVPYAHIIKAALFPALLYYFSLWFFIDLQAIKLGMKKQPDAPAIYSIKYYLQNSYLLVPMALIVTLLVMQFSTFKAAFYAIVATVIVGAINNISNLKPKAILSMLDDAGRQSVSIAAALTCASIVVGSLNMTGAGLKMTTMILRLSQGSLPIAMFLTMTITIILGMGLPTPAAYMIVAIFAPSALLEFGVPLLTSHLFCFYYACFSCITPPVALAAYAGGALAGAPMSKTGFMAMKLGIAAFIIPWLFVYRSELLMQGNLLITLLTFVTIILALYLLCSGIQGFFLDKKINIITRVTLIAGSIFLFIPGIYNNIIGVIIFSLALIYTKKSKAETV